MSSNHYQLPGQPSPYQSIDGSTSVIQQSGNPSQPLAFPRYEHHPYSPSLPYEGNPGGYASHFGPSNPSSPVVAHRPTPSPSLSSTFVLPSHLDSISPIAIYEQPPPPHYPARPPPRSRSHSQTQPSQELRMSAISPPTTSSIFPSYDDRTASSLQHYSEVHRLPDPHATRPQLSISISGSVRGHPDGWNSPPDVGSTTSEHPQSATTTTRMTTTNPDSSPRSRTVSLGAKKKKASPRSATAALPPRKRSPASCAPCRKKKLKCDRSLPCSSCVAKGTECIWEGDATPLYIKDEHDPRGTKELQAQVDRLQSLVDGLTGSPPKSNRLPVKLDGTTGSTQASLGSSPTFELLAHDLPQALTELALAGILPPRQFGELCASPLGQDGGAFLEEARHYCNSRQRPAAHAAKSLITPSASSSEPSPSSTMLSPVDPSNPFPLGPSRGPYAQSSGDLADALPSRRDVEVTSRHFFGAVDVVVPLIDRSKYGQSSEMLRHGGEDRSDMNHLAVALVVAVAACGLSKMSDHEAAGAGYSGNRQSTVRKWLEVASSALSLTKLSEWPTYDGIRAALVIASTKLSLSIGEDSTEFVSGMALLSTAVQASFALELHREPNRNGKTHYRFSESQERRRLFWALFSVCSSVATDTARTWPQFDLRYVDVHFPLDCHDDELAMDELAIRASVRARLNSETFEETPMSFNLSDEAFVVGGCRHARIAALHAELRNLEKGLPECYRVSFDEDERVFFPPQAQVETSLKAALLQIAISSEIVRVNRPFLVLAASDEAFQDARERAVMHAKRVLSIATDRLCQPIAAQLSLRILSAAIVIGIELVQSPNEADAETLQTFLNATLELLDQSAPSSLVSAQGAHVLGFLLKEVRATAFLQHHRAKRPRTARHSPDEVNFRPRQTWLHSLPTSTYPSRGASPAGSDSEVVRVRRNVVRPTLKHSARSESHLPSRTRFAPRPPAPERSHRSYSAEEFPTFEPAYSLPLSPAVTSASAPSIVTFSPDVHHFGPSPDDLHEQQFRHRTFSDPSSSSVRLSDPFAELPGPLGIHSMFRHYHHPDESTAAAEEGAGFYHHRAAYGDASVGVDTGLGLVDFAARHHHGATTSGSSPGRIEYEPAATSNVVTRGAFYHPTDEEEEEPMQIADDHDSDLRRFSPGQPEYYRHS
ncbi:hypothetical protein JCM11491_006038 [Sporobolomyces phaffii]